MSDVPEMIRRVKAAIKGQLQPFQGDQSQLLGLGTAGPGVNELMELSDAALELAAARVIAELKP